MGGQIALRMALADENGQIGQGLGQGSIVAERTRAQGPRHAVQHVAGGGFDSQSGAGRRRPGGPVGMAVDVMRSLSQACACLLYTSPSPRDS